MQNHLHVRNLTGYDESIIPHERSPSCPDTFLAIRCQWQLRCPGMPAIERPLCLAMSNDEDARSWHILDAILDIKERKGEVQ